MLNFFRQRGLTSAIYTILIVLMLAVFVIQFRPAAGAKTAMLSERCAAKVRGFCISDKDFQTTYRLLMPQGQDGEAAMAKAKRMGLRKIAVDGLVERELLIAEAKRLSVTASEDEVTEQIFRGLIRVSVPDDQPTAMNQMFGRRDTVLSADFRNPQTKKFDMAVYKRLLPRITGRSDIEFREEQTRELIASKVRDIVRAPVRVSDSEAFVTYKERFSNAAVRHISVSTGFAERYLVAASDADVQGWAKDHAAEIDAEVERRAKDDSPKDGHLRHILAKVAYGADDDERAVALGRIGMAMRQVRSGVPFAEVARAVSDDGSKATGGDVGDKTDGFVASFKAAADALKPGEMTRTAIQTQFGYHLILRDDPKAASKSDAPLRAIVSRDLYVKGKADGAAKEFATKIAAAMAAGASGDEAVARAMKPYDKGAAVALDVPVTADIEASDAGAPPGKRGHGAVVARAPTAMTDPDRPSVQTDSPFNAGGDPFQGLTPEVTADVIRFAFAGKDGATLAEPVRTTTGYAVVQLREHKVPTKEEFEKERAGFVQQLLSDKQAETLALYVQRLRTQAKDSITIDQTYTAEEKPHTDGGVSRPVEDEDEGY